MKTLLVPTDFSKNANNALDYTISLAKNENIKIILLHAFTIPEASNDLSIENFAEQLLSKEKEIKKMMEVLCSKVSKTSNIKCESITKPGNPIEVIIEIAQKRKVNLLVMGTTGAKGIKEVFVGSNTYRVIDETSCPVLVIPENTPFEELKKIIYATDYHSGDINALKQLTDIAAISNATIHVIHIADGEYTDFAENVFIEKYTAKIRKKINYPDISFHLLHGEDIEEKLEEYLKKESANILALSTKHKNIFEKLLGKSITKKMTHHTEIPLMVFHNKKEAPVFI